MKLPYGSLVQECSVSIANTLEILQLCTKPPDMSQELMNERRSKLLISLAHSAYLTTNHKALMNHNLHLQSTSSVGANQLCCTKQATSPLYQKHKIIHDAKKSTQPIVKNFFLSQSARMWSIFRIMLFIIDEIARYNIANKVKKCASWCLQAHLNMKE